MNPAGAGVGFTRTSSSSQEQAVWMKVVLKPPLSCIGDLSELSGEGTFLNWNGDALMPWSGELLSDKGQLLLHFPLIEANTKVSNRCRGWSAATP